MIVEKYECANKYKINLYKTNDDILLLDVFVENKKKHKIKLLYYDNNKLYYYRYKLHRNVYSVDDPEYPDSWKLSFDVAEETEEKIDDCEIYLNKIFHVLQDYTIYNGNCKNSLISITLIKKDLLREFSPQIDENKILLKWW
jgi:hypothetical protein